MRTGSRWCVRTSGKKRQSLRRIPVSFNLPPNYFVTPTPTLSHADCMQQVTFVDIWGKAKCDQWIFQNPGRCKFGNYAGNCAAACQSLVADVWGSSKCVEWIKEASASQNAVDICAAPNYQKNCAKTCHGCTLAVSESKALKKSQTRTITGNGG